MARSSAGLAQRIGTSLAARRGEPGLAGVPDGAWSTADDESDLDPHPMLYANPALAAYAAQLRARRQPRTIRKRRIPLSTPRITTAVGGDTGPGAMARSARPVDRIPDPQVAAVVRGRRAPASTHAPRARRAR